VPIRRNLLPSVAHKFRRTGTRPLYPTFAPAEHCRAAGRGRGGPAANL